MWQADLGQALVGVDAVVDGPLDVVHDIVSCTPDDDGTDRSVLAFCNQSSSR